MKCNIKNLLLLPAMASLLAACGVDDQGSDSAAPLGMAEVTLAAGQASVGSRAAFAEDQPITLYVYQRRDADTQDLTARPYVIATGTAQGVSDGSTALSGIRLDKLTLGDEKYLHNDKLYLDQGYTYDFVIVANQPEEATYSGGALTAIPNGYDVMVGRDDAVRVDEGTSNVAVSFTDGGAVQGNLKHLCSNIVIKAKATDELITMFTNSESEPKTLTMGVSGAKFQKIINQGALSFAGEDMKLQVGGGHVWSYELTNDDLDNTKKQLNSNTDEVSYDKGYLLPLPLLAGAEQNSVDIDFYVNMNGADVVMQAKAVHLPEFKPGYRYTFELEMDKTSENGNVGLSLTIESWDKTSWSSTMGGDDKDYPDKLFLYIGGWSGVSWSAIMGEAEKSTYSPISVGSWSSASWSIDMGE